MMIRALLFLQVVLAPSPAPEDPYQLPPVVGPRIGAIEVVGDSVLFMTGPVFSPSETATAYAFDRVSKEWSRVGAVADAERANPFGVGPGWYGIRDGYPVGSDGWSLVADYFGHSRTRDGARDTINLLQAMLSPDGDTIRLGLPRPPYPDKRPPEFARTLRVEGDTVWLGMFGHGLNDITAGSVGGLVAFDLDTRRSEAWWLPELMHQTVDAIDVVHGSLWLGTTVGIGFRRSDGSWAWLRDGAMGLPDNHVTAIAAGGDTTWVGSPSGPGGLAPNGWFGPRWVPVVDGDSVVMDITLQPTDWSERDAILRLGWLLELGTGGRDFVEAMEGLPRSALDDWRHGRAEYSDLLLDATIYPHVAESFVRNEGHNSIALRVVRTRLLPSEDVARDLLARADRMNSADGREGVYRVIGDHPDLIRASARAVLSRDSLTTRERVVSFRALRPLGEASDLKALFRHAPVYGCCIDGGYWAAISDIVSRSDPEAVRAVMRSRPLSDRIILLRQIRVDSNRPTPRPSLVAKCLVGIDAFRDPAASEGDLRWIARYLAPMGINLASSLDVTGCEGLVDRLLVG